MTISTTNDAEHRLVEFEASIAAGPGRDAFRVLVNAARSATEYEIQPTGQPGAGKWAVNYIVKGQCHYAFIVNAADLLFYYRKPSGLPSAALVEALLSLGLDAALNKSGEVTARIANPDDANLVLAD